MLNVSLATNYYDRTAPIYDGRVRIEGCNVHHILLEAPEIFHRLFKFREFDIAEMSLSTHLLATARGEAAYVGVPVFPLRMFRHSGVYIRTDRGIKRPEDLRGKIIGVPEFQQTANVWVRGILEEVYGVNLQDIRWRSGGLEEAGRAERADIRLEADVDWKVIGKGQTLNALLENGDIDAIISPRPPTCFSRQVKHPQVDQLWPDYPAVELEYFQRTRIFPIMHLIGIRRTLAESNPWLPVAVMKAFLKAKELINFRHSTLLPWGAAEYRRMQDILGGDYWSYHLEPNRHVVEAFTRYSRRQGLIKREVEPEELFAASTLDLSKC